MVLDGKQKITMTLAGIAFAGAAGIGAHAFVASHTSRYFVSTASAQEAQGEISKQIQQASSAAQSAAESANRAVQELRSHVALEQLIAARNKIDSLRTALSDTKLYEATNGVNEVSRARRIELETALERAILYSQCLEAGRASCLP